MAGKTELSPDFSEFVGLLDKHDVRYLIVGGYAVAFHGHPRYTKDIDVWVLAEAENAERLLSALEQFGFGSLGLCADDFLEPEQVIQLGYPPNRIDLLTSLPGVDFGQCETRSVDVDISGLRVRVIGLDDLKRCKTAAGRPQDLADVLSLEGDIPAVGDSM